MRSERSFSVGVALFCLVSLESNCNSFSQAGSLVRRCPAKHLRQAEEASTWDARVYGVGGAKSQSVCRGLMVGSSAKSQSVCRGLMVGSRLAVV